VQYFVHKRYLYTDFNKKTFDIVSNQVKQHAARLSNLFHIFAIL